MRTSFSTNIIFLQGNITSDIKSRTNDLGKVLLTFSLVTSRSVKKNEKWTDVSTYHRVVCFGKGAEWLQDRIHKGMKMFVIGRQENRSYTKENGEKGYISEVIADQVTPILPKASTGTTTTEEISGTSAAGSGKDFFYQKPGDQKEYYAVAKNDKGLIEDELGLLEEDTIDIPF